MAHDLRNTEKQRCCAVCGKAFPRSQLRSAALMRPHLFELVQGEVEGWSADSFICDGDMARYRRRYVETLLEDERGELSVLDQRVLDSLEAGASTVQSISRPAMEKSPTFGERAADRVASFGGSWTFILSFGLFLALWIMTNIWLLRAAAFDPYPFILLNLLLSCIAALQAPVIMMSQRRQEQKDRQRAENDYMINLRAELEIRNLHEKIDHQMAHQWERLAELQQIQIDLLERRER